ncbi:MAG: hypothetical protein IPI45_08020 [Saprospiraceae bacterium]|jgi:hypothetical protein|nr:hypothetical protein [Saprospiraceae bacterium]MBK7358834.1 hypothetical protein [Saprospiraceae bacterium]MBK7737708.1 hypothetical protein [Saprospiraceae bacterium]MBK7913708.1 hypothetical protein [Saprospiraceae bacterium]
MKNLFKKKTSKTEAKTEERRGFLNSKKENPDTDLVLESLPKGDFLETDEDLGYC